MQCEENYNQAVFSINRSIDWVCYRNRGDAMGCGTYEFGDLAGNGFGSGLKSGACGGNGRLAIMINDSYGDGWSSGVAFPFDNFQR